MFNLSLANVNNEMVSRDNWKYHMTVTTQRKISKFNYDLIEEIKRAGEDTELSKNLRDELESYSREVRREVSKKVRNGCAPLFYACKRGCVPIAEFLVTVCEADIEQRGLYEVPEDRSFHCVTPLWCAVVSGKLPMVKYLIRIGCDINAPSDSGSTPVRSACYMTHIEIVRYLVENGADIKKPNVNGGTCLINSVQSLQLCAYLIEKGADVNAKDIQEKTALHYAIQEHRLETTKLLIQCGADPFAKSRYGDDALRTACLKGAHQIFDYLKATLKYPLERIAEAHELIGSTFLDDHNETRVAVLHWRLAHHIRASHVPFIEKQPQVPLRRAYGYATEFKTLEELDNIATDMDAMRVQSLLICERILGINHKDMLFRLTFRGASYADALQMQRCIDLWLLLLEVRVSHSSILHFDTCFAAQALVRLMLDLNERTTANRMRQQSHPINIRIAEPENVGYDNDNLPLFDDVYSVFNLLVSTLREAYDLLQFRPVFRKQQENFDRVLKCVAHLIYLLINTARTKEQKREVYKAVRHLVQLNVPSACTCDTMLHLCVSRLNVIKSGYLSADDSNNIVSTRSTKARSELYTKAKANFLTPPQVVFPNADVIKLLIDCGMDVNSKNEAKSSPLHVAAQPYNFSNEIILLLLDHGADLDQPNKCQERPLSLIACNSLNTVPLMRYMSLKCLAATVVSQYGIAYENLIPKVMEAFVKRHEP